MSSEILVLLMHPVMCIYHHNELSTYTCSAQIHEKYPLKSLHGHTLFRNCSFYISGSSIGKVQGGDFAFVYGISCRAALVSDQHFDQYTTESFHSHGGTGSH